MWSPKSRINGPPKSNVVSRLKMVENIITLLNEDDHLRRPDGPYLDSDNQGEIYFTVIKYINSGAFGSVVEITIMTHGKAPDIEANRVITNRGTNTKLALKILCHSQQMGETTADSLIKPNRLIKLDRLITLNHHNVVRYVATGLLPRGTDGRPTNNPLRGVLMEFYPGGDLNAKAKSGITGKVIAGYCVQILSGVAYLHAEGIAHGDLKGMNIFLSADGNTLKIGDLENMALLQETSTHSSGLDLKCGTLEHMSPEMLSYACIIKIKPSNVGRSTDLYSIGCVVLELFNGGDVPYGERLDDGSNVPYVVSDPERFAQKVCDKRVFPVVSRSRHDLRDLRSVIAYCLAFEKNKRKSASELLPEAQKIYENWD